jgi:hypothetical protein
VKTRDHQARLRRRALLSSSSLKFFRNLFSPFSLPFLGWDFGESLQSPPVDVRKQAIQNVAYRTLLFPPKRA